ncbi:MAG TPA: hypothetical protein VIO94_00595 [Phenylobacterium sp.]
MKALAGALATGAVLVLLAACDNGPSAVAKTEAAAPERFASADSPQASSDAPRREDRRQDDVPTIDGKPMWSASRDRSAEENAQRAFERNGEAFGAKSLDEFVKKAHAFVSDPPAGAETLKRANGDLLIYDAKANVFAVRTKDGAPRTMFKPDDGPAYWDQQKSRETRRTASAGKRNSDS